MTHRLRVLRTRPGLDRPWSFEIVDQGNGRVIFGSYGIATQPEALERGLYVLNQFLAAL